MKGVAAMLSVVAAERPEDLVDELAAAMAEPLADAFSPELVSVSSLGLSNWIKQQLSLRLGSRSGPSGFRGEDGIVANVEMPSPVALRKRVLSAFRRATGGDPSIDFWEPDQLLWSVLEVLSSSQARSSSALGSVSAKASAGSARAVASLFHGYNISRPQMVLSWIAGEDVDSEGVPLDDKQIWQPHLFRMVREHIELTRGVGVTPVEEVANLINRLDAGLELPSNGPSSLPSRIFVVCQPGIPAELGPVINAVACGREVHLMVLSPSVVAMRRISTLVGEDAVLRATSNTGTWTFPRSAAEQISAVHPLIQAWGQMQIDAALELGVAGLVPSRTGDEHPSTSSSTGVLGALQAQIANDQATVTSEQAVASDTSVQIHAAPGPSRQVEVLRDKILGLLRADTELGEGDILVLCPQLDLYAPIIAGVWGEPARRGSQPPPGLVPPLRYSIVNHDAGSLNPILGAFGEILNLVTERFTLTQLDALLRSEPVRTKFELTDTELDLLEPLGKDARVRWGLDAHHRQSWGIDPVYRPNSWEWGIDQLMMGVALGDDLRNAELPGKPSRSAHSQSPSLVAGGIPPLDLDEGSIVAAGRLAAAISAVHQVQRSLGDGLNRPIQQWVALARAAADVLLGPEISKEWQRSALEHALDSLVASSLDVEGLSSNIPLSFSEFRTLVTPSLAGDRSRAGITPGTISVAVPGAMAAVPHKVVCLLGIDEGSLVPSVRTLDDLSASAAWVGDFDGRQKGRADLLAAVMSAREHLLITCNSKDANNRTVPTPAIIEEFMDAVGAVRGISGKQFRADNNHYVLHPRQAFNPTYFTPGTSSELTGYDPLALQGAQAIRQRESDLGASEAEVGQRILLDDRLKGRSTRIVDIELNDLIKFFDHPAKVFIEQTLGLAVLGIEDSESEELPTSVSGLDGYGLGKRFLEVGLRGELPDALTAEPLTMTSQVVDALNLLLEAEVATGMLPPPRIANPQLMEIINEVSAILEMARSLGVDPSTRTDRVIDLRLPSGVRLRGQVETYVCGDAYGPVDVRYARPSPKHRVRNGIHLLALTAMDGGQDCQGVLLTRPDHNGKAPQGPVSVVDGTDPEARKVAALTCLDRLVEQYSDGLACALPLFPKTSLAAFKGASIKSQWESSRFGPRGERDDPYNSLAFGSLDSRGLLAVRVGEFTLQSEAARLWGSLDEAIEMSDPLASTDERATS